MSDPSSVQIPPPRDWQAFERLCWKIARILWGDESTQMHGRNGQKQHGVDVYCRHRDTGHLIGVQCKGKDRNFGEPPTVDELSDEVKKAKTFDPPLRQFILATTTPIDAALQQRARQLTKDHTEQGLFEVIVWGWEQIVQFATTGPCKDHRADLFPESFPYADLRQILSDELDKRFTASSQSFRVLQQPTSSPTAASLGIDSPASSEASAIATLIDHSRDLLVGNRPRSARELLEKVRKSHWDQATDQGKFRILSNIGAASLALGEPMQAATMFIEALAFDASSEKALSNAALGYLLRSDATAALPYAERATSSFRSSPIAWSAWLQVQSQLGATPDIAERVPDEVWSDATVSYAMGAFYGSRGEFEKAVGFYERAHSIQPDKAQWALALATGLCLSACIADALPLNYPYSTEQQTRLRRACDLFSQAITNLADSELLFETEPAHVNYANALVALNEIERAQLTIEDARKRFPRNRDLLSLQALILLQKGEAAEVERIWARVPVEDKQALPDIQMELLFQLGRYDDGKTLIEARMVATSDSHELTRLQLSLVEACRRARTSESALEMVRTFRQSSPSNPRLALAEAELLGIGGDIDAASSTISEVVADPNELDLALKVDLADTWYVIGQYHRALPIYEDVVQNVGDCQSLQRYLYCCYRTDHRAEVEERIAALTPEERGKPIYLRILGHTRLRAGRFEDAAAALQQYCALLPDDLDGKLTLISAWIECGEFKEAHKLLHTTDAACTKLSHLERLAALYEQLGALDKSMGVRYRAYCKFPNEPEATWRLAMPLLLQSRVLAMYPIPTCVGPDTAVSVSKDTAPEEWLVFDEDPDGQLAADAYAPSGHPYDLIAGCKVGDIVTVRLNPFHSEVWTVNSLQHKYVYRARTAMRRIQTRFPAESPLAVLNPKVAADGQMDFNPLLLAVDQQEEFFEEVIKAHKDGLPLPAVAFALKMSVVDCWWALTSHPGYRLPVVFGDRVSLHAAAKVLRQTETHLQLEPVSLLSLFELDILKNTERAFGKLGVTRSLLDFLSLLIEQRAATGPSAGVLFKAGTRYAFRKNDPNAFHAGTRTIRDALHYARQHCDVLPAVGRKGVPLDSNPLYSEALGEIYVDAALAASGAGRVLLSDDPGVRDIAKTIYGVDSIWTQAVLLDMHDRQLIDDHQLAHLTERLINWNYYFVSVREATLRDVLKQSGFVVNDTFRTLVSRLRAAELEPHNLLFLCSEFIAWIWSLSSGGTDAAASAINAWICITENEAAVITGVFLEGVAPHHFPGGGAYFYIILVSACSQKPLADNTKAALQKYLADWWRGRFLSVKEANDAGVEMAREFAERLKHRAQKDAHDSGPPTST